MTIYTSGSFKETKIRVLKLNIYFKMYKVIVSNRVATATLGICNIKYVRG